MGGVTSLVLSEPQDFVLLRFSCKVCNSVVFGRIHDNIEKFNLKYEDADRCEECILNERIDCECSKCKNIFQQKRRSTNTRCSRCIEIGDILLHNSIITVANVYLRDKSLKKLNKKLEENNSKK